MCECGSWNCQKKIPVARLNALPNPPFCINCERQLEKHPTTAASIPFSPWFGFATTMISTRVLAPVTDHGLNWSNPMRKYIAMMSVSLGLVLVGLRLFPIPEPPGYSRFNLDPAELSRQGKHLDDLIHARDSFMAIQENILERLVRRELSLSQACDRFYQSAREVYPRCLAFLRRVAGNIPLKKKIAYDLVDCFRLEAEDIPSFFAVASRLELELSSKPFQDWCGQSWVEEPTHP